METWKQIEDYEGFYFISNYGRVRDCNNRIKPTYKNNKGYVLVSLYYKGKTYHKTIHRLVATYFLDNKDNLPQVNHIDCNKENNNVLNLEWCDQHYNYKEGMKHFLYSKNDSHYFSKLKNQDVVMLNRLMQLGFTRATLSKIFNLNPSSIEAIEKGISYRELNLDWNFKRTKYKDKSDIKLPSDIRQHFRDNTVLNTLISQGKVSV